MSNSTGIKQLDHWLKDVSAALELDLALIARKLTLDAWTKLTEYTPVDTGRARASWGVSLQSPSEEVPSEGEHGVPSAPDVNAIDGTVAIFITSRLVYMEALEHGHSKQAPHGMVRLTIAELNAALDVAVATANASKQ